MHQTVNWFLALLVLIVVVMLIAFARGEEHHRGDEVGAHAVTVSVA